MLYGDVGRTIVFRGLSPEAGDPGPTVDTPRWPVPRRFAALVAWVVLAAAWSLEAAQPVRARHAMVVTRERHATSIGLNILQSGGNVVDAAVAVGFALAVTHPSAGNIGGGGFMLLRLADGRTAFIDFRERAPQAATRNMYVNAEGKVTQDGVIGYRASGVPGTVRGLEYASQKYGKKPWPEVVAPAVELAGKGFPLSYAQAESLQNNARSLSRFPETNRIFLREGKYYQAGDVFVQPDLAHTLARIQKSGARDFYEGETAHLLAKDMQEHGGLITLDDLKEYTAIERQPLTGSYRGYTIVTAPPPSSGGIGILQMLGVLEGTGFEKGGAGSATAIHYMTEAMRRYYADRSAHLADPDFFKVPLAGLLEPKYLDRLRASIDPERATPSTAIHAGAFAGSEALETTHFSIADADGNMVCVTYTLNGGYGSKVTATGLGFLLNNEMDDFAAKPGSANTENGYIHGAANAIQPRKTPLSSMTPTMVLRDGKPYLALGSPGGLTIINTVLEVIVNVLDFGMGIQDAVNWPRFHHQWMPDELRMEAGYSPDTIALLEKRGYTVKRRGEEQRPYMQGEVAAIRFWNGWLEGAADPRVEATAEGH